MHPIDLAVVVAYVALITFVGIRFAQRVKNAKDFFLAGRSLTWWVIGLSIIGTNVDTNGYIGASGNAYSIGIAQANFEMDRRDSCHDHRGLNLHSPLLASRGVLYP